MLTEPVTALLSQGKRVLRQVVVRSTLTFMVVWALGTVLGIAISVYRGQSIPAAPTWLFVIGVSALPATVAGQVAGVVTMLLALTELIGAVLRLPQALVNQLATSAKDVPSLALSGQKGGRAAPLTVSLLSALGVAMLTTLPTLLTARFPSSNDKTPV